MVNHKFNYVSQMFNIDWILKLSNNYDLYCLLHITCLLKFFHFIRKLRLHFLQFMTFCMEDAYCTHIQYMVFNQCVQKQTRSTLNHILFNDLWSCHILSLVLLVSNLRELSLSSKFFIPNTYNVYTMRKIKVR